MRYFWLFILIIGINITANAQKNKEANDSITSTDDIVMPESMTCNVDSLLADWHNRNYIMIDTNCVASNTNPVFSDSVYMDRLSRIPSVIEMPYNAIVKRYIDQYATRSRKTVAYMLGASNFYMPIIEEALDAYDIPQELKYLPVIESAMNPSAVSRAGATGLWQFMISTGKIYGLTSNSLIDERRDPIKSTWAAVRYLRDLYVIYQDWNLVIAAYNCGPGNINKAIRRANGSRDYWAIYNYLPRETRGYVPAFIAANYIMTYYCEHNICPMETLLPANTDTVQVTKDLHFTQISDICGISADQIRSLNPQYKRDVIPGHTRPCTLRLPRNYINTFIDSQDTIYSHRASELFKKRATVTAPGYSNDSSGFFYHRIKSGESLSVIAEKYGVSVRSIKRWNNMRSDRITAGKRLKIYQ